MWSPSLVLAALLAALLVAKPALSNYCEELESPSPPCRLDIPRDVIFLLDGSNSMDPARFFGEMIDFVQAAFCSFDQADPNTQAGIIVFNQHIRTYAKLTKWKKDLFYEITEDLRDTRFTQTPACCSCCTPTAEAFDLAEKMFDDYGENQIQIAFVVTDGVPSNNNANTGGNPAYWYYGPTQGFNPARYNAEIVSQEANQLKQSGRRVILLGVPNALGVPPAIDYFTGRGVFANTPHTMRLSRDGKEWTHPYRKPPNPIVSQPVEENSFVTNSWDVDKLLNLTVSSLCRTPRPTASPTMLPTMLPSKAPTEALFFDQVDVTFVVDRSTSMIWQDEFCQGVVDSLDVVWRVEATSTSACWDLFMRYILAQSDRLADIRTAGRNNDRRLAYASTYAKVGSGLRVSVVGFACTNGQKTPKMFQFSEDWNNGKPIGARSTLVGLLDHLRANVMPFGGTCPHLAIEQAVKYVESSPEETYPFQSVILVTDGVFYDMPAPVLATEGLKAYNVLRFSVGIAVAKQGKNFGMTPEEIETQRTQLKSFVEPLEDNFFDLGELGWARLLTDVSEVLSTAVENFGKTFVENPPMPRYTWCGWRRIYNCKTDGWRQMNCRWPIKRKKQYGCQTR